MSTYGVKFWDSAGNVTFDSSAEHVLFWIDELVINGDAVGVGLTYSYPAHAGRKICAFLTSPYGGSGPANERVMSCRVSYPGGVPTVSVFFVDQDGSGVGGVTLPKASGYLTVFHTGAPQ